MEVITFVLSHPLYQEKIGEKSKRGKIVKKLKKFPQIAYSQAYEPPL